MPYYTTRCATCRRLLDIWRLMEERDKDLPICHGQAMRRVLTAASLYIRPDVSYQSPIDGRVISSERERREDLKRSDCVPYEPGIKQDQERNERLRGEAVEREFDQTIEREIASMSGEKRERLAAELDNGIDAAVVRTTPGAPNG